MLSDYSTLWVAGASAEQGGAVVITENGNDFRTLCHLPVEKVRGAQGIICVCGSNSIGQFLIVI